MLRELAALPKNTVVKARRLQNTPQSEKAPVTLLLSHLRSLEQPRSLLE